MLRGLDSVLGSTILATDGESGKVYDVFFDDRSWTVHYLVVETGSWFARRKVLISPEVLGRPDWTEKTIAVLLTREQVQNSPDVDADQPVSRQQELALIPHGRLAASNMEPSIPVDFLTETFVPKSGAPSEEMGDPHLRRAKEVSGYQVDASDGVLGNIVDFIVDDAGWGILNLVVNAESARGSHKGLVPSKWITGLSWPDRRVKLNQPMDKLVGATFLSEI